MCLMLIAGAKYCPNESAQIWGEHRVGIAEVGKYVVPCYSSSSENSPHCEAEGLISREQNCPVLPDGTGSSFSALQLNARACQALPAASWTCSNSEPCGGAGQADCMAVMTLRHSLSTLTSFLQQYLIDCPQQVCQI